jgi:hypothetical protein
MMKSIAGASVKQLILAQRAAPIHTLLMRRAVTNRNAMVASC